MDRTINEFFEVKLEDMNRRGKKEILCPCKKCENGVLIDPSSGRVKMHLLKHSFMLGYTRWTSHGEEEDTGVEEATLHDEKPEERGMKKEIGHENQPDGHEVRAEVQEVRSPLYKRQKEQSDKDVSKKEDLDDHDDQQSGVYQEECELRLKTKCTKRSRNTLLGSVESSVERIQKRRRCT